MALEKVRDVEEDVGGRGEGGRGEGGYLFSKQYL